MHNTYIKELFSLKDKIIIVTGGLGQLGRQFCTALIHAGAKVAIFDYQGDRKVKIENLFEKDILDKIIFQNVDVTNKDSIKDGIKVIKSHWGIPYGLINNAALDSPPDASPDENGPFEKYPEDSWEKVMSVNVKGVFLCCQIIGEEMAKIKKGAIINICSTYGLVSPDQRIYEYRKENDKRSFYKPIAYSASKSALLNITRYLATYWANSGIRVNTLTFGGVFNNQDDVFVKEYSKRVPLGRMANQNEYNGAVVFLLSEASSYMTGSNLVIDGGWTAW